IDHDRHPVHRPKRPSIRRADRRAEPRAAARLMAASRAAERVPDAHATFEPVAIVGQACVLPGALSPSALWEAVSGGRDLLSAVPAQRWRLPRGDGLRDPNEADPDRSWSNRGGYVSGFESVWNPEGFTVPAEQLAGLDPLVHWVLHCAREALRNAESGCSAREVPEGNRATVFDRSRIGVVFGNLGFPSEGMAEYAARVWRGQPAGDPRNRAMSSATAELLREALELGSESFCIDAA